MGNHEDNEAKDISIRRTCKHLGAYVVACCQLGVLAGRQVPHEPPRVHNGAPYITAWQLITYPSTYSALPISLRTPNSPCSALEMSGPHHVGQRLSYEGAVCTVRYIGEVAGTTGAWLGVEWDDQTRGKHDGSHKGVRYFTCMCWLRCLARRRSGPLYLC